MPRSEIMIGTAKATVVRGGVKTILVNQNPDRNLKAHFKDEENSFSSYLYLILIVLVALIIAMLWFVALIARQRDREEKFPNRSQTTQQENASVSNQTRTKILNHPNESEESRQLRKRWINYRLWEFPGVNLQELFGPFAYP